MADDLEVRRLGFGTVRLTGPGAWGRPRDAGAATDVLRHAVDRGVNLLDTADAYGPEVVEEMIAEALHPYPADLIVATKGGLAPSGPGCWERDGRPERLKAACEGSLRRLRLDRIDLYQLHAVDPNVPIEESVGALAELQAAGTIRHVGLSNVGVEDLHRAQAVVPVVSVQVEYNVGNRVAEAVLDECERQGLAFLPWSPLGRGGLSRLGGPLTPVARRLGATPAQVAVAWLLHRSPVVVPIPGTGRMDHLVQNLAAAELDLDPDSRLVLDRLAPPAGVSS